MATRKAPLPPLAQLQGALAVLDNRAKRPTSEVLAAVGGIVRDAIAVMQEPDAFKRRIGFVLLAIQESTEVRQFVRNDKTLTRVRVVDLDLYNWAMSEAHALAGGTK